MKSEPRAAEIAARRRSFCLGLLVLVITLAAGNIQAVAGTQKNILILTSEDTFRPGFLAFQLALRNALTDGTTNHLEFFTEALDQSRFPEAQYGASRLEYFRWKYSNHPLDLIIAGPTAALDFLIAHRDGLFPGVPVVFADADADLVRQRKLPHAFTGLPMRFDVARTLDLAMQLQPETRQVVVVVGKSAYDQSWESIARAAFRPFEERVRFRYLSDISFPAMLEELSHLSPHCVVVYLSVFADAAGATHGVLEAGPEIARRANAPVYSPYEGMLGLGVVGGYVGHVQSDARSVASLGLRILNGENPSSIPVQEPAPSFDTVDWRAMQRWGLRETRLPPDTEVRFRQRSFWEEYKWQLITIHAVALAEGFLIFILLRNRRRLKKAQTRLSESQERLTLVKTSAKVGFWSWTAKDGTVQPTAQCRDMLGLQPDEPLDYRKLLARVRLEDRAMVKKSVDEAINKRMILDAEFRIGTAVEQVRWLAVRGQGHYVNGTLIDMVGVVMDVSERRKTELAIQRHRAELAHMSRVSTMGQLTSALAHELNQPLGAILRNAEAAELFLQSPNPDLEELRQIITDIRADDQRAAGVIDRLRLLLKRRDIVMQTLDAGKLADETVPLLRPDALSRRVALEFQTEPDLPPVRGDRVQLQQVLLNLIMNAMDAVVDCAPEKRRVKLQVARDSDEFVAMAVGDSGHGIPVDKLKSIFEPFFTTKSHGLGLGLSISRTIIEAHGGRISAVNNLEGGATFRFTVPVANGDALKTSVE